MKAHWITAALLTSALAAGCNQTPPNADDSVTAAPASDEVGQVEAPPPTPVDPVSPNREPAVKPAPAPPRAPASGRASAAPKPSASSSSPAETEPVRVPEPPPAPRVQYRVLKVPAGTPLPLELLTPLSSETAQVETPVRARLKQAVSADGYPILPMGTELSGTVTEVGQAGRVKGRARLVFAFTDATIAGAREKLHTNPVTVEAEASKGEDATKIGAGAGIGAVIGGILGGGSGAAKGAAIGGAAGTGAVLATKGKDATVAAGADIAAALAEPFEMRVRVE